MGASRCGLGIAAVVPSRRSAVGGVRERNLVATGGRKSVTRQKVLSAALELFSRDGFEGTSVKDIAQRAKVGHGTVFWHFGDKAQLYAQAIRLACDRLLATMRCDLENDDATLAEVLEAWVCILRRAGCLSSLLWIGCRSLSHSAIASEVASLDRRLVEYWEGRLDCIPQSRLSSGARRLELAQVIVAAGSVFSVAKDAVPLLVEFAATLEMTISEGYETGSVDRRRRSP